jgi:uroporphyrinogen-III decarboxylase
MDKEIKLVGAPSWYGTPLEQLDFEWSREEELELERYCQSILKNIANEEMTPTARFEATMAGSEKDRLLIEALYFNLYAVQTLNSAADALKPVDVCRYPKLLVKAHLATVARFALDFPTLYPISYTHEFWGGRAQMTEYGNPGMIGDAPIKSVTDLEGLGVPDPYQAGLFPGYLWACREIKRVFAKYGVHMVMPLWVSLTDPMGTVIESMIGWTRFIIALRKDKELCRRALDLATEWVIRVGQAMIDMGAECIMMCSYPGAIPIGGNEWMLEYYARIGKILGRQVPMWYGLTFEKALDWLPAMYERGAVGPGSHRGWFCVEMDYRKVVDFSREHDLYCSCAPSDKVITNGPIPLIEEEIRERCDYGKSYPKFAIGIAAVDYLTPQANFEAAIAAAKKYGKLR